MFLYAKLMIHDISQQVDLEDVNRVIEELPDGLEQACASKQIHVCNYRLTIIRYERILTRIKNKQMTAQSRARRLLEVLLRAKRELRVSELWQLTTMENTLKDFRGEDLLREQNKLEMLCGAIIETTNNGIIQFVHFTAKE
jgi:hypothetical protein